MPSHFDSRSYGEAIAEILASDGDGQKLMPLTMGGQPAREMAQRIRGVVCPPGVRAGLFVYAGSFELAHEVAQDLHTPEGSYWHAVLHRREPDPGNASYWFHRVGEHPVFPALLDRARDIAPERDFGPRWDPYAFIEICEAARHGSGGDLEQTAREIQLAEWQLLFDYCVRNNR